MRRTFRALSLLALFACAAQADIVVAFDQATQSARPGDLLIFTGVISYNPPDIGEVFLNSDDFTGLSVNFTILDQFFTNVPISLTPGTNSGDIELFDVQVGAAPLGSYSGTYKLFGGVDGGAQVFLASADFSVQVVPEPSTIVLLATALVLGALSWILRRPGISRKTEDTNPA